MPGGTKTVPFPAAAATAARMLTVSSDPKANSALATLVDAAADSVTWLGSAYAPMNAVSTPLVGPAPWTVTTLPTSVLPNVAASVVKSVDPEEIDPPAAILVSPFAPYVVLRTLKTSPPESR